MTRRGSGKGESGDCKRSKFMVLQNTIVAIKALQARRLCGPAHLKAEPLLGAAAAATSRQVSCHAKVLGAKGRQRLREA
jgi:hypothetical protein